MNDNATAYCTFCKGEIDIDKYFDDIFNKNITMCPHCGMEYINKSFSICQMSDGGATLD